MKPLFFAILAASAAVSRGVVTLATGRSAVSLRGSYDGQSADSSMRTVLQAPAPAPPSCEHFVEMLGQVYYMRDQLDSTVGTLNSTGRETGQEWFVDQGIGDVTTATLRGVVCPLLSNTSKPLVSLLAQPAQPAERKADPAGEEQQESTYSERMGLPAVQIPGWLYGGSDDEPATSDAAVPATHNVTDKNVDEQLPGVNISDDGVALPPVAPVGVGCPAGSLQNSVLAKLVEEVDGNAKYDDSLQTIESTKEDLLSIENGVMALYKYRGCPAMPESEFKTRFVCELHRDEQAKALRVVQSEVPEMRSRLLALQSRLRDIDSGMSNECISTVTTTQRPLQPLQLSWCLELQSLIDALLDGRPLQTQWLKDVGAGMQRLGTMAIRMNRHIEDEVLRRDKIPLNALHALKRSWKHMQATIQHLRYRGSVRAKQVVKMDVLVLQLSALLRNVSTEEKCVSETFRMRYSAQTCASLRSQLSADAKARQTDLDGLQGRAQKMLQTASDGLTANKCTATPSTAGCWVRMPTGCPKVSAWSSADKWTRDVFGEQSTGAAESKTVCTMSRRIQMNHLCGVEDAEMRFQVP